MRKYWPVLLATVGLLMADGGWVMADGGWSSSISLTPYAASHESTDEPAAEVQFGAQTSARYNDHIEFGLSIDPNTSSLAGREDPQLQGIVQQVGLSLAADVPFAERFELQFRYEPLREDYLGEDGQLDVFDAFSDTFTVGMLWMPGETLPPISLLHRLIRLDRQDDTYDSTQRQFTLGLGRFLEYSVAQRQFNDQTTPREDFLLVGSISHQLSARTQLLFQSRWLARLEYSLERETYRDNLNTLVLGIAGLTTGEKRSDWRHFGGLRLIELLMERLLLQQEANLLWNRSDAAFYDFTSAEFAADMFYRFEAERWLRLRFSYLAVQFGGRTVRGTGLVAGAGAEDRRDAQWSIQTRLNWRFRQRLNLLADYQWTRNGTNETASIFDFLNYTNRVLHLSLGLSY